MRVIYRGLAVGVTVAVAAVSLVFVLPQEPDGVAAGPIAAPSTPPSSSGPDPASSASSSPLSSALSSALSSGTPQAVAATAAAATPLASGPAATADPASPDPTSSGPASSGNVTSAAPRPTPTPGASLAPGYTAMEALYADARLPRLPEKVQRVPLRGAGKYVIRDRRSGLAVPRLGRPWKTYGPAPFTSRQVLPKARGTQQRGMIVTCPLPIEAQEHPRDTALLAARWTLNHHPEGATIRWFASQPVKDGWMLAYQVKYGKRTSRAAVAVVDGGMSKPGLVFVTVPDAQKKRWHDITRVVSGVRALG
ncbi:hypothetical protein AB0C18_27085 [Nonomuraea muscovyensis]|uniref:hypothetical protein n=1 Tax=Nonomuraea muscovyensis TaxID=1124761 RepID=UPI0033D235CD